MVIVEPRYQINLGYSARVALNFGIDKLYLVNPKCNYTGYRAIMYSKHARKLLENAIVCKSIGAATKDTLGIGTTGLWRKAKGALYNVYEPAPFLKFLEKAHAKSVALIIGREGTGLSTEELRMCDASLYLPAYYSYSILNTSHALAVLLYVLTQNRFSERTMSELYATAEQKKVLINLFKDFAASRKNIRDKKTVVMAFTHIINRSMPTKKELSSLASAISMKSRTRNKR